MQLSMNACVALWECSHKIIHAHEVPGRHLSFLFCFSSPNWNSMFWKVQFAALHCKLFDMFSAPNCSYCCAIVVNEDI